MTTPSLRPTGNLLIKRLRRRGNGRAAERDEIAGNGGTGDNDNNETGHTSAPGWPGPDWPGPDWPGPDWPAPDQPPSIRPEPNSPGPNSVARPPPVANGTQMPGERHPERPADRQRRRPGGQPAGPRHDRQSPVPHRLLGGTSPFYRLATLLSAPTAIMVLAAFMLLSVWSGETRLLAGLTGSMTVELPANENVMDQALETGEAVSLLNDWPGIEHATPIDREVVEAMLAPWFGAHQDLSGLPLPMLIDITLAPDQALDLTALAAALDDMIPGAGLDDHRQWAGTISDMAGTIRLSAWVVLLLGGTAVLTTTFGFAVMARDRWNESLVLMHDLGAGTANIVRAIARPCFHWSLVGAALGTLFAILLALFLAGTPGAEPVSTAPFAQNRVFGGLVAPQWWHIPVLSLAPMVVASIAVAVVGMVVHRHLKQLW